MLSQLNDSSVLKQPKYTCISLTFLEQKKMVVIFLWLMAPASYGGKAILLSCGVSEGSKKIPITSLSTMSSAEFFIPHFLSLTLGFGLFWNIFGCSMLSDNFFESDLIVHLLVYYRRK